MSTKIFRTFDHREVSIDGLYRDQSLFILFGGPSLAKMDLSALSQPGIMTMGVNNSPKIYRPKLWVSGDTPSHFMVSIWKDPTITKFASNGKSDIGEGNKIFDNNRWQTTETMVRDCPGVVFYGLSSKWNPDTFLTEKCVSWGNHGRRCECGFEKSEADKKKFKTCPKCGESKWGTRSVFLIALKIAYVLGFRTVYLVGCDFRMEEGVQNYAWDQDRARGAIRNNNKTYGRLNERCDKLRPIFEKTG